MRLLVNNPTGEQIIVEVDGSGEYFGDGTVVWDERLRGDMGYIVVGKMDLANGALIELPDFLPGHTSYIYSKSVPQEVPIAAACEALINAGLYDAIDSYIQTLAAVDKVWWQRAFAINRHFPLVDQVRVALNLTELQIDQLFVAAEQIRKQRSNEI